MERQVETDAAVRHNIYDVTMSEGMPPTIAQAAATLGRTPDEIRASFQRLADETEALFAQLGFTSEFWRLPRLA